MTVYSSCTLGYSDYVLKLCTGVQRLCIVDVYWGTATVYSSCVLEVQ